MRDKVRFWLIKILLTQDEKYMLVRAMENRVDELQKNKVISKDCDSDNSDKDIYDYSRLKLIFGTRDYN